jgi:hypothetical protein
MARPDDAAQYPSTDTALPSTAVLTRGATVLTGDGRRLKNADLLMSAGRIKAVGTQLAAPPGAEVTTAARRVFIRGRDIPVVSRQTLLRDRYSELA